MATQRHWKQSFDPNARFIYRKRRKFALDPEGFMRPGELMPKEVQMQVGRHRLKMWWRAGWIELADFVAPRPYNETMAEQMAGPDDKSTVGECLSGPAVELPEDIVTLHVDDETGEVTNPKEITPGIEHRGGGWYDVTLPDGSSDRVHGKVSAQLRYDSFDG